MSRQDPKVQLLERLEPEFATHGFKLVKARAAYERQRGDVEDMYKLDFLSAAAGHRIQPGIIMRFADLDRIYHRISGAKPADQKFHAAISFAIWRVYGGRDKYEFLLTGSHDFESVAGKLLATFREIALPFFESHSTVSDVDRLFNTEPNSPAAIAHQTDGWTRTAFAIIAAKLAGNPAFPRLVETYDAFLKNFAGGHHYERFRALRQELEHEAPDAM